MARSNRRTKPTILFVDDKLAAISSRKQAFGMKAEVIALTPADVTAAHLERASVVLVDYLLTDWTESLEAGPISNKPMNGLALAATLMSHCDRVWPPTAFALHSAELETLSSGLPARASAHIIARENNLEWVFSKTHAQNARPLEDQVLALAEAVAILPAKWPTANAVWATVDGILGLRASATWSPVARRLVASCRPPLHGLDGSSHHGLTFLRWLAHQILPYPTFLWDDIYLAARLRVTPNSLTKAIASDPKLVAKLKPYLYTGALSALLGRRWWRSGIEHFLWKRSAHSMNEEQRQMLAQDLSDQLVPLNLSEPVVVLGNDLRPKETLVAIKDAVEVRPDYWPAFADTAWADSRSIEDKPLLDSVRVRRDPAEG